MKDKGHNSPESQVELAIKEICIIIIVVQFYKLYCNCLLNVRLCAWQSSVWKSNWIKDLQR